MLSLILDANKMLFTDIEYNSYLIKAKWAFDFGYMGMHAEFLAKADQRAECMGLVRRAGFWMAPKAAPAAVRLAA